MNAAPETTWNSRVVDRMYVCARALCVGRISIECMCVRARASERVLFVVDGKQIYARPLAVPNRYGSKL